MNPIWISIDEAVSWTGRPKGTIWRWASEGRVEKTTIRSRTRYNLRDLNAKTADGPGTAPPVKTQQGVAA